MAKRRVTPPSEDERALFRQAVADVKPISGDTLHFEPPPPAAYPKQRELDERAALAASLEHPAIELRLEGGDEAAFLRDGLARNVLRDLRRGRWIVQDEIDLHGATRNTLRPFLAEFLADCLKRQLRCVRVIHGKGLGSPGRLPVLKDLVKNWLATREEVLAYCQASGADGGSGALLVLLRAGK